MGDGGFIEIDPRCLREQDGSIAGKPSMVWVLVNSLACSEKPWILPFTIVYKGMCATIISSPTYIFMHFVGS